VSELTNAEIVALLRQGIARDGHNYHLPPSLAEAIIARLEQTGEKDKKEKKDK
jgi:hypothetical protein